MHPTTSITYIGHATLLIEIDGVRILTDPTLRSHVSGFIRRQTPIPAWQIGKLDLVLISHLHFDHFDLPSLRLLEPHVQIAIPSGAASYLRHHGFQNVREVRVGDRLQVGEVEIIVTPAKHKGRRHPFGPDSECVGYLIKGSTSFYFAGDTDILPEMHQFSNNLDVAFMPVWDGDRHLARDTWIHCVRQRRCQFYNLAQPFRSTGAHFSRLVCAIPMGICSLIRHGFLNAMPATWHRRSRSRLSIPAEHSAEH